MKVYVEEATAILHDQKVSLRRSISRDMMDLKSADDMKMGKSRLGNMLQHSPWGGLYDHVGGMNFQTAKDVADEAEIQTLSAERKKRKTRDIFDGDESSSDELNEDGTSANDSSSVGTGSLKRTKRNEKHEFLRHQENIVQKNKVLCRLAEVLQKTEA